jgi:RNA polymerase sigma factor (sigma-70 family)
MKIAAITRYKQGDIYTALQQLGWTQTRLAQEIGCWPYIVGLIINLKKKPTVELANKIQAVFGEHDIYIDVTKLWPETFQPLTKNLRVQVAEVELLSLEGTTLCLEDNSSPILDNEEREIVEAFLDSLSDREKEIVTMRFFDGLTLNEIGLRLHISTERVRQIILKTLRKCRRPRIMSRMTELADTYESHQGVTLR